MSGILTRADDLRLLEALDLRERLGMTFADVAMRMPRRDGYRMSRGGVIGILSRVVRAHEAIPCNCVKPDNRDGGMPERWWGDFA